VLSSLGVFSLAGSFRYFLILLGFRRAHVAWACFAWLYFLLENFFFSCEFLLLHRLRVRQLKTSRFCPALSFA